MNDKSIIDLAARISIMPEFASVESPLILRICEAYEAAKSDHQPDELPDCREAFEEWYLQQYNHFCKAYGHGKNGGEKAIFTWIAGWNTICGQIILRARKRESGLHGYEISGNTIYIGPMRPDRVKVADITCTIDWDETYTEEAKQRRIRDAERICRGLNRE